MKALLFDFGGTLDTDGVHWSEKFWDMYQRAQVPLTKSEFERAYVDGERRMTADTIHPGDGLLKTLQAQVMAQFAEARRWSALPAALSGALAGQVAALCHEDVRRTVERIRPVLEACRSAYRLAIVSNFYGNLETVCRELAVSPLFSALIDSTVVGVRKPTQEIFRRALDRLRVRAADAAMLGDSYDRDVVPAKELGCTTIWLHARSWKEEKNRGDADYEIRSLQELPQILHLKNEQMSHR